MYNSVSIGIVHQKPSGEDYLLELNGEYELIVVTKCAAQQAHVSI